MRFSVFRMSLLVVCALCFCGCDEIKEITEEVLDDEATALEEDDLPNCSRAVNCCTALEEGSIASVVPDVVSETCQDTVSIAANSAIDEYQRELAAIDSRTDINDESRASLRSDLVNEWQNRVEPGCRCFMEETVGTLPDLALPLDCEPISTTGDLDGATCTEALESLTAAPTTE